MNILIYQIVKMSRQFLNSLYALTESFSLRRVELVIMSNLIV